MHGELLVVFVAYVLVVLAIVAAAGFVLGWAFRKGWDRAGRN